MQPLRELERSDPDIISLSGEEIKLQYFLHWLSHCVGKNEWSGWHAGGNHLLGQKDQQDQAMAHVTPESSPELCWRF